jgi:hypothetical protein
VTTWTALTIVVVLVLANQIVMRSRALWRRDAVFWANVAVQGGAAVVIAILGLPGAETVPLVRVLLVMLFAMHAAQDVAVRNARLREEREDQDPGRGSPLA